MKRFSVLTVFLLVGCASRPPVQTETTMPNPDGCFVQVWDGPRFMGTFDYINGPRVYGTLRDLPGGRLWQNRIHSIKVPPGAMGIAYSDENLQGERLTLRGGEDYPTLPAAISGAIESLEIRCFRAE